MLRVTKRDLPGILYCEDTLGRGSQVTFFAISCYTERRFVVVTRSTRFALLHLQHRITDTTDSANKNGAVTFTALIHCYMVGMAEFCFKSLKTYFINVFVAFLAIAFN